MISDDWEFAHGPTAASLPDAFARGTLVSYAIPAPELDMATFLRHAQGQERFYWQHDAVAFAGFGAAAELFAWGENRFEDIQRQARALFAGAVVLSNTPALATPRLFGGFAFRDDFTPDITWSAFHPAHFILPHYQLMHTSDAAWLTINSVVPPEEDPRASLAVLAEAVAARYALLRNRAGERLESPRAGSPTGLSYPMPFKAWADKINAAIARMHATALNKVVLARVCEVQFDGRVDVDGALAYLDQHYAGCYRFLFEPRPSHAFFGATPELLACVHGRRLTSMGLAGSIRRGHDAAEDERLAQRLLASEKDRYEHALVVESMRRRLAPVVACIEAPDTPQIYRLSNIQHLHTPLTATLDTAVGILPLVRILHPTPALGGQPRDLAMQFIREAEPVPRGWYAAPIGWIDHNLDGEFGVAIRSAVVQDGRAWLYAGAGIVADSVPQTEWEETGLKFRPMMQALGVGNG